jgi:hypothetical protein
LSSIIQWPNYLTFLLKSALSNIPFRDHARARFSFHKRHGHYSYLPPPSRSSQSIHSITHSYKPFHETFLKHQPQLATSYEKPGSRKPRYGRRLSRLSPRLPVSATSRNKTPCKLQARGSKNKTPRNKISVKQIAQEQEPQERGPMIQEQRSRNKDPGTKRPSSRAPYKQNAL